MSILELKNVIKVFNGNRVVDEVSIGVEQGMIMALIGPNGAGKTTIFNLVTGFLRPDSGEIIYLNKNIVGLAPWDISRLGIGRLFQDVRVFERMKTIDNVLCAFKDQKGENVFRSVFTRWKIKEEEKILEKRALDILDFVGLKEKSKDPAGSLSFGQQKLLSIARLLATGADVFLLDEPTAGISSYLIQKLFELIRKLAKEGKTIIFIEHNMSIVIEISDWVYFINAGQVESFGLPQDVLGDPDVKQTYIGI